MGLIVGFLSLDPATTSRLPWGSAAFGGVALALLVAVPNTILAVFAVRGDHRAGSTAIGVGVLLVGWIVVELAFIRELSFFHPLYVTVGLVLVWLGARVVRLTTGVTGRTLLHEAGDCLIDLPVFVTSPLYRRWHLRWGATDTEVRAVMDGDELLPRASYVATRAITIDAPIERVWPWLVQAGCLRAGFYSDDLLDNLGRPSARTLRADLQQLSVGMVVPMSPNPTESTSFRVDVLRGPVPAPVEQAGQHLGLAAEFHGLWGHAPGDPGAGKPSLAPALRWTVQPRPARARRLRDDAPHAAGHPRPGRDRRLRDLRRLRVG